MNTSIAKPETPTPADFRRSLKLLTQCTRAVTRIQEEKALLVEICRIAVDVGGYRTAWVACTRPSDSVIGPCAIAGDQPAFLTDFTASWAPLPGGTPGPICDALRSGAARCCLDLALAPNEAAAALQHGYRSLLALPLTQGAGVLGVWVLYGHTALAVVPEAEIDVLQEIADNLAFALSSQRASRAQEISRLNASLEERVQLRTAQLKRANEELESFCYSVSHDLRTPLSAVDGFAHLLEQALDDPAEPQAEKKRHFLRRIRAGVLQMGELIEALLQLARLARAPMNLTPVDLSRIANEVLTACREREPARVLVAEVEPGLTALCDARLIRQLLGNLLGNAWKFSSGKEVTHIRFARAAAHDTSTRDGPEQPVFVVEDKGAGFNMAYAENLFGPFRRLHSPSEFEGTGIGLATAQRIVHRHGGRVWGEAEPGQGARFYFSLGHQGGLN